MRSCAAVRIDLRSLRCQLWQAATAAPSTLWCTQTCFRSDCLPTHHMQPVKSFKLRGAYNKMAQLTPEQVRCARCAVTSSWAASAAAG